MEEVLRCSASYHQGNRRKLREIGDHEAAEFYELQANQGFSFIPEGRFIPRKWLDTSYSIWL